MIYRIRSLPETEKQTDKSSLKERMRSGWKFLDKHRPVFLFGNASLFVFLTIIIFGSYVLPVYVASYLHQGGDVYAFGDMAFSLGALLAGFITTSVFSEKNTVTGIITLSVFCGFMYLVMLYNQVLFWFFTANFFVGVCNAGIRIQRITYLFHHVPNHIIGRANSIFFVINVFLRVCMIGLLTLPFFHRNSNISWAVGLMSLVCFSGALLLLAGYKKLVHQPVHV
jgi:MFS family permease